ncbi:hypothetical protein ASD83_16690 [Devosia sp. Root685]|nr:hypothetical protein ASD83_16690 [Devosia sp. Root685]
MGEDGRGGRHTQNVRDHSTLPSEEELELRSNSGEKPVRPSHSTPHSVQFITDAPCAQTPPPSLPLQGGTVYFGLLSALNKLGVIPAKAGIPLHLNRDSRFRGNDAVKEDEPAKSKVNNPLLGRETHRVCLAVGEPPADPSPLEGEARWGAFRQAPPSQPFTPPLGGEVELRSNSGEGAFRRSFHSSVSTPSHARFPADAPRANLAAAREVKE